MRPIALTLGLTLACALALALSALAGPSAVSAAHAMAALFGGGSDAARVIVWEIRLPRALAAFVTGAALGLSGAALQGLLRNPLAEPGVLGVSASAALGAATAISFGLGALSPLAVPIAAIAGALLAVALLAATAARGASNTGLILVGVGISSLAGALMAMLMATAPNPFSLSELVNWMLGSVANRSLADLAFVAPFLGLGALLLSLAGQGLRALTLGEEAAAGLGARLSVVRLLVIAGGGLATGASVAIAGVVGFVGLITPHLVRPLVGRDPASAMWPSALLAGLILVSADLLIRLIPSNQELKLGVLAALIGAPVFIVIAARGERP